MIVYSHRRSGTHLLMEYLKMCFGKNFVKKHVLEDADHNSKFYPIIYVYRDGRDTLTSCYHWWKTSGESRVCGIQPYFKDLSFSDYLKGIEVPGFREHISPNGNRNIMQLEVNRGLFRTPVSFWCRHIESCDTHANTSVKFESLINCPERVMERFSDIFEWKMKRKAKKLNRLVGYHPRKGKVGDHWNMFSAEDYVFFDNIAGALMKGLGYYEE